MEGRRSEEPGLYMPPNDVWTELGTRKTDIQDLASDTDKKSSIYMALGQTRVDWGLYKPFAHTWTMTTNSHQIWGYSHFHNEVTCISLKIFSAHIHLNLIWQLSRVSLNCKDSMAWDECNFTISTEMDIPRFFLLSFLLIQRTSGGSKSLLPATSAANCCIASNTNLRFACLNSTLRKQRRTRDKANRARACLWFLKAQAPLDAVITRANSTPPIAGRKKRKIVDGESFG